MPANIELRGNIATCTSVIRTVLQCLSGSGPPPFKVASEVGWKEAGTHKPYLFHLVLGAINYKYYLKIPRLFPD